MPDIFVNETTRPIQTKGSDFVQPVREATPLFIGKIVFALILPIFVYILVHITSEQLATFFSLSEDLSLGFLLFLALLSVVQVALVLLITLQWKNHVYYLTENYIQENSGIFTLTERMYDLKNVRDISIRQGMMGRMFNYGDIIVESTAPDSFHEVIILVGTPNPHQHVTFLKKFV